MKLISEKAMNRVVSHTTGVRAEVAAEASRKAGQAKVKLLRHFKTGAHEVTVTHGKTDSFINLDGPAPLSVEFGHEDGDRYVEGLYIITGAAGLLD